MIQSCLMGVKFSLDSTTDAGFQETCLRASRGVAQSWKRTKPLRHKYHVVLAVMLKF